MCVIHNPVDSVVKAHLGRQQLEHCDNFCPRCGRRLMKVRTWTSNNTSDPMPEDAPWEYVCGCPKEDPLKPRYPDPDYFRKHHLGDWPVGREN